MTDQEHRNSGTAGAPHAENLLSEFGAPANRSASSGAAKKPTETEPPKSIPAPAEASTPAPQTPAPKKPAAPAQKSEAAPAKKSGESSKKTSSSTKKSETKSTSGAKGDRVKAKNQSTKEKKPTESVQASTATPKKEKAARVSEGEQLTEPRSSRPAHRVIPYVLLLLAVFIGISLLLNLFCNFENKLASNPSAHWMGVVGYYICYGLFGVFGPAVFVVPPLLILLAVFWRKYIDHSVATAKILCSCAFLLLLGATIHVFSLQHLKMLGFGDPITNNFTSDELLAFGAQMTGGGVLGGKLGYAMIYYLNVAGSLIVSFFLLIVTFFYCLGMTPRHVLDRIRASRRPRVKREPTRSEEEAEEAHNRAQMEEKIRKITAKQSAETTVNEDGVEVISPAKKPEVDKRAPMPMPRLEPTDGSRPFVPKEIGQ